MTQNNKNKMERISITLPKKLLEKINRARGLIPRSTFIAEKMKRIKWRK